MSKEMVISCRGREFAACRRAGSMRQHRKKKRKIGWISMNFIGVYLLRII
jgi:hypothetical protein